MVRPADPSRFNGIALVNWQNGATVRRLAEGSDGLSAARRAAGVPDVVPRWLATAVGFGDANGASAVNDGVDHFIVT